MRCLCQARPLVVPLPEPYTHQPSRAADPRNVYPRELTTVRAAQGCQPTVRSRPPPAFSGKIPTTPSLPEPNHHHHHTPRDLSFKTHHTLCGLYSSEALGRSYYHLSREYHRTDF
ncbi:uncharacterized protein LOC133831267 isoform X2 [Humulus lupulus]|uniref:uncharacterized protein LOC133831267 isoform X2 n=1 Tax=Humulus lupulus TaxID=3486 RepID=UPI002B41246F|nr:uncharacterized protein LOC133831267 isoform X2 [Humulus lupulus]